MSSLHIAQQEVEGIVILDLNGPLSLGHSDEELRDRLGALFRAGKFSIVLNLKHATHIDSTGLGTLVFAFTQLRKANGRLALANLNCSHLELLLLTKLSTVFELFGGEQDAVNSFFPDRAVERYDILSFVEQQRKTDRMEEALAV
jgi:anti-sigma B factor antagonist